MKYIFWDFNGTVLDDAHLCYEILNEMLSEFDRPTVTFEEYLMIFDFPVESYYAKVYDLKKTSFKVLAHRFIERYQPRSLELNYSDWRNKTSVPQVYLQKTPSTFWVIPVPGSAVNNGIQLAVALKPSRTTSNIDTIFSNSYRDGIVYGTLYRLMRIPAKDWTDPTAAADYLSLFNQEIVQAELKARGGDLGVKRTVKYRGAGLGTRKRYKKYGSEIDY